VPDILSSTLQVPERQPDYASQTKSELEKVQQKAILMNDMLNNIAEGEQLGIEGDVYEQVSGVLKAARPKIQKWIGEAGEDNADLMGRCILPCLLSSLTLMLLCA
jgi:ADP-ribosylation factor-binding protein GGA